MQSPKPKSKLADLIEGDLSATGSLRHILMEEYHNILAARARGWSWTVIGNRLDGRSGNLVSRAWRSLQTSIESGKIALPGSAPATPAPSPTRLNAGQIFRQRAEAAANARKAESEQPRPMTGSEILALENFGPPEDIYAETRKSLGIPDPKKGLCG